MPVALVTGASSGIGRGAAIKLASEGYSLHLVGRQEAALKEVLALCQGAPKVEYQVADVTRDAEAIVQKAVELFGQIDTLINSAGILVNGAVIDADIELYDRQMDVNVRSVITLTKAALPHLIKTKGTIVNVSSIAGPCPFPNVSFYCMSKAALDQFTKCLALEMAPHGVRVNAVCPGVIQTEVHLRSGMTEEQYKEFLAKGSSTHALGRIGEVSEVAEAISFLASAKSSFTTGHLLRVDGGRGIMHPR